MVERSSGRVVSPAFETIRKKGAIYLGVSYEIDGQVFGRLTALKRVTVAGRSLWECICECGNTSYVGVTDLNSGKSKSCGCLRKETMTKHGMYKTRFYKAWDNMRKRCESPSSVNYEYYGGRGITVCAEWKEFENFKTDMYESYLAHVEKHGEKNTTLDRVDVNGNYEASNTAWATMQEQSVNKRMRKTNTSGHVGVSRSHGGKWRARITADYKEIRLGVFDTIEEAIEARTNYKNEMGTN